ncbi:MAG: hypothetical protein HFF36_02825 [Coprobacillus sp.]|nr:hypothetical protein [Coprobacillus sp.]
MSLTKEECTKALDNITLEVSTMDNEDTRLIESNVDVEINLLDDLIKDHFDNPSLKLEELKENMWVWDRKYNMWNCILETRINCANEKEIEFKYSLEKDEEIYNDIFEENRFYRKQVEE